MCNCAFCHSYLSYTQQLTVPDNILGASLNFTLDRNDPRSWAIAYDFGLIENAMITDTYLSDQQILQELQNLERTQWTVAQFVRIGDLLGKALPCLKISHQVLFTVMFHFIELSHYFLRILKVVQTTQARVLEIGARGLPSPSHSRA